MRNFIISLFITVFGACTGGVVPCKITDRVCQNPEAIAILESYDTEVEVFAAERGLSPAWVAWMKSLKAQHAKAYIFSRQHGAPTIRFFVTYDAANPEDITWFDEEYHFEVIQQLLSLSYPGWNFEIVDRQSDADITLVLGYTGQYSNADVATATVYLIYQGILAHEFGHLVGINHHYCNPENLGNETPETCPTIPPEEDEDQCIMLRNTSTYGITEQFLLGIGQANPDEIQAVIDELNGDVISVQQMSLESPDSIF